MQKTARWVIIAIVAILVAMLVVQALAGCAREKPKDLRPEPATPTMKDMGGGGGSAAPNKPAGAPSGGGG